VPGHSTAEALKMNSVVSDGTPLVKVSCHTLLLAVLTGRGAPVAVAIGPLASV